MTKGGGCLLKRLSHLVLLRKRRDRRSSWIACIAIISSLPSCSSSISPMGATFFYFMWCTKIAIVLYIPHIMRPSSKPTVFLLCLPRMFYLHSSITVLLFASTTLDFTYLIEVHSEVILIFLSFTPASSRPSLRREDCISAGQYQVLTGITLLTYDFVAEKIAFSQNSGADGNGKWFPCCS